ncbi:AraC family transcriptional regulator [Rivularia sp. UHCC 0363]|uniref:helix-turn-helix transcriptional regulator n=1 Tax=Rivularia sp. UHCC 0363 TaxID=3110244 RepID=UPI002B209A7C|nr:AraC family transcriptional regulator [Rivularia sp. UHCC 0363]MEA5598158.1 AraC family transcriptional regulator [Rivularia sp. UHCC 0363]
MTITVSSHDWKEFWQEEKQQQNDSSCLNNHEHIWSFSNHLGKGYQQQIFLRSGIFIYIHKLEFVDNIVEIICSQKFLPEFGFHLKGKRQLVDGIYHQAGENFLAVGPCLSGTQEWSANTQILKVDIHIEPSILGIYLRDHNQKTPSELNQLLEGKDDQFYFHPGKTTPQMQVCLHQILNCPYHGATRQIYLESKTLELIAMRLQEVFSEDESQHSVSKVIRANDIERIYHAKEILRCNFENPPSLPELARKVGLNQRKLKQGFRACFGTTAFGYLHDYRMEQARLLLTDTQMGVTQVAYGVGYASLPSFSAAFRKKFGICPRTYTTKNQKVPLE